MPEARTLPAVARDRSGTPPCRVLQVVTSVCAGGLSRYLLNLLANLDPRRVETHLVCTHFEGPHLEDVRGLVRGVTVFSARSQVEKLQRLTALMRQVRPHAVQAHQEPAGLIAAALCGVRRRIDTVHTAEYWLQDGHPLLQKAARAATTEHVVCTRHEGERITPATAARKVRVVHPGYDLSRVDQLLSRAELPPDLRPPDGAFVVGTVARLDPEKGVRHLVEAAPRILAACPDAWFLLVGDGGEQEALRAEAARLGVAERVCFAGYQAEAHRLLGAMDVFVMPSLTESWGFAVVEAMAAGLPVVCSDTAGPASFLEPGRSGLRVPIGDAGAIADEVVRLYRDAEERKRLGEAARECIRERVSVQQFIRQYEGLYGLG